MRQLKIIKQITNRESPALEKYLHEIGRIPLLTGEEEVFLSRQIKLGDRKALATLIRGNLRFVISVAKQYQNQGLPLADLISEGNLGLIRAAEKFDSTKGFKFISYAVWWIRQSILQTLAENARMVKLPQNKVDMINKINQMFGKLEQEYQREPTAAEIADLLLIPTLFIDQSLEANGYPLSLDAPLSDDSSFENSQYELFPNDLSPCPDNDMMKTSLKIEIERLFSKLERREAEILCMLYGLNEKPVVALDDISRSYGLTRERIRQIRDNGIKKLKGNTFISNLRPYMG